MSPSTPRKLIAHTFARAAADYARSLQLEDFMEATSQATQRKITLESLDLVHARRPDVQVFNELLVQYQRRGQREIVQVVPDNMVVIHAEPVQAEGSFVVPLQHPIKPFWMLEYVSRSSERKDYQESFEKYERDLKVPYYLLFYPEDQELTLYRHNGRKYVSVKPNTEGRLALAELELEIGIHEGWARYWYQGKLLPLPADLQRDLEAAQREVEALRQRAELSEQRADEERQRAEQSEQRADEERRRAELSEQRANEERQRAEQSEQRAEQERQRAEQERRLRLALEQELERLRTQGNERRARPSNGK